MKKDLMKIDFSKVEKLDDRSLQLLVGGTAAAGPGKVLKKLLKTIGIDINGSNCRCSSNNCPTTNSCPNSKCSSSGR